MQVNEKLDAKTIRKDFPVLSKNMNGKPLVYLDNAATTQKPFPVIDRINRFYSEEYATVHRGVYSLSQEATETCEEVRRKCARFLNASKAQEIVFVRGTTEAINLIAAGYGKKFLSQGDEILVSALEHHANLIPWQRLAEENQLTLKIIPIDEHGSLRMEEYKKLLTSAVKLVAVNHISNALGTINPVEEMARLAHEKGAVIVVDGAQAAAHLKVDVQDLDCDFYAFSGHKIYGPTGIGVLYAKLKHLEAMEPYQTGGEMIKTVTYEKAVFAAPPYKFEAGTPAIAETVGLGAALDYLTTIGLEKIEAYEHELLLAAAERLRRIPEVRLVGTSPKKSAIISFLLGDIHPHDIGTILDQEGIAIRTGNHCAQPLMNSLGLSATARASFSFYNTPEEIEILAAALEKVRKVFQ